MAHILLVDDDQDILRLVRKVLVADSHSVATAEDPFQALRNLKSETFDLVITDANMPHASGFDLLRGLRQNPKFKDLPIALLTARRDRTDIDLAVQLGVEDYIIKPIDPPLLQQKVRTILQRRAPQSRGGEEVSEFKGITLHQRAFLKSQIEILGLSEIGLRARCSQQPKVGDSLEVDAPLFKEIGISAPHCKISKVSDESKNTWLVELEFIGAGESRLQKIRAYMNQTLTQSRAKVG